MKSGLLTLLFMGMLSMAMAQPGSLSAANRKALLQKEDSMKLLAPKILFGINPEDRLKADSLFTRQLVRALRMPNSFSYPFDSLENISRLYAPDSSFRIITWQLEVNPTLVRQHGAIQLKTTDGSLKLFPLIDKSEVTENIEDTIGNNMGWMGAVYYRIVAHQIDNRTIYTLLGFDANNFKSNKKIIEVLEFVNGEPRFGSPIFRYPNSSIRPHATARYVMEYKKDSGPRLTYDDDLQLIIMEHLVSESNEPMKKYTLVGDGDYEGFRWMNNQWIYVGKVFNQVTPEGQAPVPKPIRSDDGTIDESKLNTQQPGGN